MVSLNVKVESKLRYHLSVLVLKITHQRNLQSIYSVNCEVPMELTRSLSLFRGEPILSEVERGISKPEQSRDHGEHLISVRIQRITHQALNNGLRQFCPCHFH